MALTTTRREGDASSRLSGPPGPVARLSSGHRGRRVAGYATAVLGTLALTLVLLPFRDDLTPLSKGFFFLVVVVAAASIGGLGPGLVASVLGFLVFNFLFIPPYGTFTIAQLEHVMILFVFLGLSVLISALLARATERAEAAELREAELRTLQSLSADLVAAVPGPDSYEPLVANAVRRFGFDAGALFVQDPETRELTEQVAVGASSGELEIRPDPGAPNPPTERLPLSVGGRVLGLLLLRRGEPLAPADARVLRAYCDQFALVLERDRLLRTAAAADAFRQSDTVRRSLLAAVSHDLRSPLAAIKTSVTDLLSEDGERSDADTREALRTIDLETERLEGLVANLLDMSRIEGGVLKAKPTVVDLRETLTQGVERARRQAASVRFDLRVHPEAALAEADPIFLDRVVANLLDNAVRATRDAAASQQSVELDVRLTEGRPTVRVIDHGKGVPADIGEQLFYPFYQIEQRHPRHGTGLGLAISKGFLVAMGGDIWIEQTPGGGATFAFSLPSASAR
jgi:two-component system sensor histidine kinase KdpD